MVREVRVSWDSDEELSGVSFRWGDRMTGIEEDWDDDVAPVTIPMRQTSLRESVDASPASTAPGRRRRAKKSRRTSGPNDEPAESMPKRNLADANWLEWVAAEPLKPPKHPGRTPNRDASVERG